MFLAGDDTLRTKLFLSASLIDYPQNTYNGGIVPSMQQATSVSNALYDLSFWGIHASGKRLLKKAYSKQNTGSKIATGLYNYSLGLLFSKYGSELPVPLGIWSHEEYHRTVLGVNGIRSKNGNWIFHRWDGTVYGVGDQSLADLKTNNINGLLYSYVAGVQSEQMQTKSNVVFDTYNKRTFYKNPLYLYNAYYTWNYFRFATSPLSDSVKIIAPQYESTDPYERDFAGADLNAWVYDMFNPGGSYFNRDSFPNGDGINRRIGFSDLSVEGQNFLNDQKKLSLLNFINPAIFCINRININENTAFNFFFQYNPTHFGNAISLTVPVAYKNNHLIFTGTVYSAKTEQFWGFETGISRKPITDLWSYSLILHGWNQPENQLFADTKGRMGGAVEADLDFKLNRNFHAGAGITVKSKGWMPGSPYLSDNVSARFRISYRLYEN
ncbi:MAG: hypothetical protein Fur0041_09040 [Bacteroidia bacterium]